LHERKFEQGRVSHEVGESGAGHASRVFDVENAEIGAERYVIFDFKVEFFGFAVGFFDFIAAFVWAFGCGVVGEVGKKKEELLDCG